MTATDRIEKIGHSTIHHGPLNRRIYLMKLDRRDLPEIVSRLLQLADRRNYGKILAKVPERAAPSFRRAGFVCEACIPGYFSGGDDAWFLSLYPDAQRRARFHRRDIERCRRHVETAAASPSPRPSESGLSIRTCRPPDLSAMQRMYREVFETYPFPIYDREYLAATMAADVRYYGVRDRAGHLVALASGEMDSENQAVEMTDFAVLPSWRRRGLSARLLRYMEADMRGRGMRTAFTIARTRAPGINIAFCRRGYRNGGLLVNNTHIAGQIESMWVWYKKIRRSDSD